MNPLDTTDLFLILKKLNKNAFQTVWYRPTRWFSKNSFYERLDALDFPQPTRPNWSLEKSIEFDHILNWNVHNRSSIILRGKYSISINFGQSTPATMACLSGLLYSVMSLSNATKNQRDYFSKLMQSYVSDICPFDSSFLDH